MVSSDKYATAFAGTLPKPHKPTLNQSFAKESARQSHPAKGIFCHRTKNKTNLCFVDRLLGFETIDKEAI